MADSTVNDVVEALQLNLNLATQIHVQTYIMHPNDYHLRRCVGALCFVARARVRAARACVYVTDLYIGQWCICCHRYEFSRFVGSLTYVS